MLIFVCMKESIFCDYCTDFYVFICNFAVSLGAAMVKVVTKKENLNYEAKFAWKIAQVSDHANIDCALYFYTWYIAEAIKKSLLRWATIY